MMLLAVVSSSAMAEWTKVSQDENSITYYADYATILYEDNKAKVWHLYDFTKASRGDLSVKTQLEYDCKEKRVRTLSLTSYKLNGGRGKAFAESSRPDWRPVKPNSLSDSIMKNACEKAMESTGITEEAQSLAQAAAPSEENTEPFAPNSSSALTWEPLLDFEDLFPSYIIATSTMKAPGPPPNYFGDPYGLVGIRVHSASPNTKIRGVIEIDQLADRTEFSYTLPTAGKYLIYPKIKFHYQQLANVRQPITVNVSFSVAEEGATPEMRNVAVRVRAINDAVISSRSPDGRVSSMAWALGGFVNENHPAIDSLLREALNLPVPIVQEFVGYQRDAQEVINQVFAIWYVFQRRGFTYSSITTPTGVSSKVQSQFVRFFEDSLRTQQANCIDGTVLFASILRRIDIDPMIIIIPGHAFLGFYLDQQHKEMAFLETTAMNTDANPYRNQKASPFRDSMARAFKADFKLQRAAKTFDLALAKGQEKYQENYAAFQSHAAGFVMLEVDKMRQIGIQPINH